VVDQGMIPMLVSLAFAHIGIESPPPRYPSDGFSDNKNCPCGVGTGGTLCSGDSSDPDRGTDITVYAPGETITIAWHEVIGHSGRYRVAFDDDGADLDDFNANILLDIEDPVGSAGNTGLGDLWEVQVTLPSTPCDNCTLQLIQVMNGNTVDPVPDPTGMSTYYQCADIALELPDTGETGVIGGPTADTGLVVVPTGDTGVVRVPTADTGESGPGSDSNVDTGREDTGREDTGPGDTGRNDTGREDTGRNDTGREDTGRNDTGAVDSGPSTGHTGAVDTGSSPTTTPGTTPGTSTDPTDEPTDGGTSKNDPDESKGCGCQARGLVGGPWLLGLLGLVLRRR